MWIIFQTSDIQKIGTYLKHINVFFLTLALFTYGFAHLISAYRSRYYFAQNGLALSSKFAIALYFLGTLYNTILPGGISGDGYKIYAVKKYRQFSKLTALRVLLSDRASGLFMLIQLSCLTAFASHVMDYRYGIVGILGTLAITFIGYHLGLRLVLKESWHIAIGAIRYSICVQILNMLVVVFLLWGLEPSQMPFLTDYIIAFMVSSVLAILPITIGGAGIREVTFIAAAQFLPIEAELGVALAVLFFIVNVSCSLLGILFMHRLKHIG